MQSMLIDKPALMLCANLDSSSMGQVRTVKPEIRHTLVLRDSARHQISKPLLDEDFVKVELVLRRSPVAGS